MREAFLAGAPRTAALRAINYPRELSSLSKSRKGHFRAVPLRSMLTRFGDSYWSVFTRLDCAKEHGVELISQTDMFVAEPEGRVIRRDSMPRPEDHEVARWQVLVAGAGQMGEGNLFGRSIIADDRLTGRFLGPHAVGLTFEEPGGPANLWTYAFLNTGAGLRAVKSCAFGTSVPGLRLDLLGDLSIPIPEDAHLLARVADHVRATVEQRERFVRELRAAREVIDALPEMQEAHLMCAERRPRAVVWTGAMPTLSAWNFASAGDALAFLRRKWNARFGDVLAENGLYYGARSARITCQAPFGVDFVSQRDAFLIRPIPRRVVLPGVPDEMIFMPEGGLVLAARGTLGEGEIFGRPVLIAGVLARLGLTEDLLRVLPTPEHRDTAYAYLSTLVGLRLIRATAVGTKILNLRFDLLRELPFPTLSPAQRQKVEEHVGAARAARSAADAAEAAAIRVIEEEVLPSWLD